MNHMNRNLILSGSELSLDLQGAQITSLKLGGKELVAHPVSLFRLRLLGRDGEGRVLTAYDATACEVVGNSARYSGFPEDITVTVSLDGDDAWEWRISVENRTDRAIEWVSFPEVTLQPLAKNGGDASILFPYNEGVLVDDAELRDGSSFRSLEPLYPSLGCYAIFPNMICSQFQCYLSDGRGLYMGAHDARRGVKAIDFTPDGDGVAMWIRTYCGGAFGASWASDFAIVWKPFEGDWQDGAEIYRTWLEQNLPQGMKKITENDALPEWYADSPLIITYPVRGLHDTDEMTPNALFPYLNVMPCVEELAERIGTRIMVLLMHCEGTAPWAPPYVWPPFGGEEALAEFCDTLHRQGHLLGVYCSGFGWTEQSNLIDSYNCAEIYECEELESAMCAGEDGIVQKSRICKAQRSGYDICVGSARGRELLNEAYRPLFESTLDYVQILDQNHGGGQYFCYSRDHGHPPTPGAWMTETMQAFLGGWNRLAPGKLFGCESAAAEPFIPNLLFSDNRFELNWTFGQPVPLYAYLYHEYLRNFMGNQVSCGISHTVDSLPARLAYSFVAGDCMTLVLDPTGGFRANWGRSAVDSVVDRDRTVTLIANLTRLYREGANAYLASGRMCKPIGYRCGSVTFPLRKGGETTMPSVLSTAWESADGSRVQLFVNHTDDAVRVETDDGRVLTVPPLDGVSVTL